MANTQAKSPVTRAIGAVKSVVLGNTNKEIQELNKKAEEASHRIEEAIQEIHKVVVGQEETIQRLFLALLADGHVLLQGVPGLAKTLLIRTLAQTIKADFKRLQFTPDLLPADIIGTKIYNHQDNSFSTQKGPIFANFILADEINRAPPKVQSALLESMQERQVTIQGDKFLLPSPFLVLATMNPLEHEGVYVLPEAQVDRFMFKVIVNYPSKEEEKLVIQKNTRGEKQSIKQVLTPHELKAMQQLCKQVYADEKIEEYIVSLVDATRNPSEYKLETKDHIEFGASPRASIWLMMAAKAHALINGRGYVMPEDVQEIAPDVLRHRILLTYEAEADGITTDHIITKLLETVNVP